MSGSKVLEQIRAIREGLALMAEGEGPDPQVYQDISLYWMKVADKLIASLESPPVAPTTISEGVKPSPLAQAVLDRWRDFVDQPAPMSGGHWVASLLQPEVRAVLNYIDALSTQSLPSSFANESGVKEKNEPTKTAMPILPRRESVRLPQTEMANGPDIGGTDLPDRSDEHLAVTLTTESVTEKPNEKAPYSDWTREQLVENSKALMSRIAQLSSEVERLTKLIAKELNENDELGAEYTYVNILKAEVERLKRENDDLKDPIYCPVCGSCGEDGCCSAERCIYPGIKAETVTTMKEIAEDQCQENVALRAKLERAKGALEACAYCEAPVGCKGDVALEALAEIEGEKE